MKKLICKRHFVDVLLLLSESPKSFNELLKILKAYPDTLNNRIKEMLKLGLIVQVNLEGKIKYKLTDKGLRFAEGVKKVESILDELEKLLD